MAQPKKEKKKRHEKEKVTGKMSQKVTHFFLVLVTFIDRDSYLKLSIIFKSFDLTKF